MKKSTILLLLASTVIGSNVFATAEVAPESIALMSPADIQALNEIAHQINAGSFKQTLISRINQCDQNGEKLDITQLLQDMTSHLSDTELKEMLAQLLSQATEKAESAQCEDCTLLAETMGKTIIALEKNQLTEATATTEKAEDIKTELGLN